ncbi:MAG: hypothetical protein ACRDY0_08880 [Acidimicrobiales bacterium]
MDPGGEVVELGDLPAAGLGDPASGPGQDVVVAAQLRHGLGDRDELVWPAQVTAQQPDKGLRVAVEHGQTLLGVRGGERVATTSFDALLHVAAVGREPELAQSAGVADRVHLEEVLIVEAEPDHPAGQLDRISVAGVARPGVQVEQCTSQVADQPVGVVRLEDHLHDVPDRPLDQQHQLGVGRRADCLVDRLHDGPCLHSPAAALSVAEVPARVQPAVDLRFQLGEIPRPAGRRQADRPSDVLVALGGLADDHAEVLGVDLVDQHVELLCPRAWRAWTHGDCSLLIASRR